MKTRVAQNLYHDGVAVILDFKRSSHRWAFGLPNVYYAKDLPDIHDALVAVGQEAERRNVASDDPDADLGPRITLVAEEMNATIARLGFYWENTRVKGDSKTSPAIAAVRDVLFMGRSTAINVVAVAQMFDRPLDRWPGGAGELRHTVPHQVLGEQLEDAVPGSRRTARAVFRPRSLADRQRWNRPRMPGRLPD